MDFAVDSNILLYLANPASPFYQESLDAIDKLSIRRMCRPSSFLAIETANARALLFTKPVAFDGPQPDVIQRIS